jgi:hypothetical protein
MSVITARELLSPLRMASILLVLVGVAGCGGSTSSGSPDDYPMVESPPPEHQPPVTMPNGAVVTLPALPTVYETDPSPTCERELVSYPDGIRPVAVPPAPGLRAVAVTTRTTRIEWSFQDLPEDCRPVEILLSVVAGTDPRATPTTERGVEITGVTGSREVTYPEFLPPPDVARASAYSREGFRSRVVSVLIRRSASTPPDPPEPTPPVTAPAGQPITCVGQPTVVDEPAGDVLTYAPGKPPAQVRRLTPALSGIDLTRAAVQIDGRTICATFTFARTPTDADFELGFNLADTTEASCCASLRFRRTAGRLEVGYFYVDANGVYQLEPTPNAGAALRGATLVITGTIAPPSRWQYRARRMPATNNLAWSVTTRYYTDKYGPYYGDWLPRHEPVGQPAIRHRDGAIVQPGS